MAEGDSNPTIVVATDQQKFLETKGILKKRGRVVTAEERAKRASASIQWDEMNILATEHPPGKDYGHMKIDEPKTPYHEMVEDESINKETENQNFTPEALELIMQQSQKDDITAQSKWERESSDEDEQLTEEEKKKKEEFRQWRKAHYNEYAAVQRARQLIQEDEEELRRLEEEDRRLKDQQVEDMDQ